MCETKGLGHADRDHGGFEIDKRKLGLWVKPLQGLSVWRGEGGVKIMHVEVEALALWTPMLSLGSLL